MSKEKFIPKWNKEESIAHAREYIGEENYEKLVQAFGHQNANAAIIWPLSQLNRDAIKENWVDVFIKQYKKSLRNVNIFLIAILLFIIWGLYWLFSWDDETKEEVAPTKFEQSATVDKQEETKPAEEPKPQEDTAYTTCMSQTEYLKWADKERLIKACEKNNVQDASLAKNQEYAKKHKWDIVIGCRKVIKEQLKQPSSADFRELSYYTNYQEIIYKTEVISKNDFNAEVRNIVICTLDIKDGKPGTINAKLDQ